MALYAKLETHVDQKPTTVHTQPVDQKSTTMWTLDPVCLKRL